MKKLADDQCALINKGSIYHIKYMSIQPLSWEWIDMKLDVKWKYLFFFDMCVYILHFYLVQEK